MGKSTTAAMFADLGVPVWDADAAVHRLYAAGGRGVDAIAGLFPDAAGPRGVDRGRLRAHIADDPAALGRIETVIHPLVAADRAEFLRQAGQALCHEQRDIPSPGPGQVRVRVEACAVCRTDLHVVDGELPDQKTPVIPGHEIVGLVEAAGEGVAGIAPGARVGIAWLAHTCGRCLYCRSGRENLCDSAAFTGHTRDGGFASHVIAEHAYTFPLPGDADPVKLAPLMCAGMIGWRCLRADLRQLRNQLRVTLN
jgi:hypothetical protein